jgi:hypothetical protein
LIGPKEGKAEDLRGVDARNFKQYKNIMSIFNERDTQAAIAKSINEKLRQNGLSGLSFKLYFKSGGKFDIVFEGASASDIKRVSTVLGTEAKIINKPSVSSIDSELKVEPVPMVQTTPKIATRPKSK